MEVIVLPTASAVDHYGANLLDQFIRHNPRARLGLATGQTPLGIYARLVKLHELHKTDWSQVETFNLDEYLGLSPEHAFSYHHYMRENLFEHVNLSPNKTHLPDPTGDPVKNSATYEKALEKGLDYQLLGIGQNAHIGFNEPGSSFESKTRVVDLAASTIKANARYFPTRADVPRQAISMGISTILRARKILLVATGSNKASAIKASLEGPVSPKVPASVLQRHPDVTVLLDRAAASKLTSYAGQKV
ncbi:glucosamine-6-phosphate deaminase [Mycoplasma sp. ATU-Cv-703]|uniref:glucosamine-6-phosphate deaminase n=1 Tax=Mycoplasma sp. ATU-Cv-703 TaxID=2498595 RepID=UPI000FDCE7C6